jgi:hypothetical protein
MFRAVDERDGTRVVVKVFPRLASSAEEFRREAAIAMRARHPSLVGLLDAGVAEGEPWLTIEYVPGPDVRTLIVDDGPMDVRHALDVATQIFAALDALHRLGLAHGDVKPDNVLLSGGRVRLIDFGRARLHHLFEGGDGMYPGTAPYMHPSLFHDGLPNARTDCFAAWVTTYELITGSPPYAAGALRRGGGGLPPHPPIGDPALDRLVAAGLDGVLGDARTGWLALMRYLRGRSDLPCPPLPPPEVPMDIADALVARARRGASVALVGPAATGRAALEGLHRDWVGEGGWALWVRADWGSPGEPLSGALSLAGHAADALEEGALAGVAAHLGPLGEPLAAVLPAARAWLGTPASAARSGAERPGSERLVVALTRLLEACPRPLVVLVDGLDRVDGTSRRFLASLVTARAIVVLGTSEPGAPHGMPEELAVPLIDSPVIAEQGLESRTVEVLGRARLLGLAFGPRLAVAAGITEERLLDAALDAEARGAARWDGRSVIPVPGVAPGIVLAERWYREAAARLDAAAEPLLVARYAMLGRDRARLAQVLEPALEEATRMAPSTALELLEEVREPSTPAHRLRHLQVALLARDKAVAQRILLQIQDDPAATQVDRTEAEGELAFATGATVPAIAAFRRAAQALGRPIATGLWGQVLDVVAFLRVRLGRPLPPRPDARLAHVLERLYDLHFCSDNGPLLRLHGLWLQAAPNGVRSRSMEVVFRTVLGMGETARAIEAGLREELHEDRDPPGAAVLLYHAGVARLSRGETLGAFADGVDAAERLLRVGDPALGALASTLVWVSGYHLAALPAMIRLRVELRALVAATGDRRAGAWLSGASAAIAWLAGDTDLALDEARAWAEDAERRADATGILARRYMGELLLERGDLDGAVEELERCRAGGKRYNVHLDWIDATVIGLLVADARLRLAGRAGLRGRSGLKQRLATLIRLSPRWTPRAQVATAWQALADGRRAAAEGSFTTAEADARARQQHHDTWWVLRERALALDDAAAAGRAAVLAAEEGLKQGGEGARGGSALPGRVTG